MNYTLSLIDSTGVAMDGFKRREAIRSLEGGGEESVRTAYNLSHYANTGDLETWVREWLSEKERQRKESSQADSLDVAKSAKDAAWAAAEAARDAAARAQTANIIATLALAAAVIAIAVSVIAVFLRP